MRTEQLVHARGRDARDRRLRRGRRRGLGLHGLTRRPRRALRGRLRRQLVAERDGRRHPAA